MEICYANHEKSLFKTYRQLLTSLTDHQLFRDYLGIPGEGRVGLLLPNGYHLIDRTDGDHVEAQAVFSTQPCYAQKLYRALTIVDLLQIYLSDLSEAQEVLAYSLGLIRSVPDLLRVFHFNSATFNPNASPETTSTDGLVFRSGVNETWATIIAGAGTGANHTDATDDTSVRLFTNASTAANFQEVDRGVTLFDTSSLTSNATVSSATASIFGHSKNVGAHLTPSLCLVACSPASNTTLAASDYNIANWTMTLQSATTMAFGSWSTSGYNDFALNGTGIGNVNTHGITKFGWVSSYDQTSTDPSSSTASDDYRVGFVNADNGSNEPKLVVTYTVVAPFFLAF